LGVRWPEARALALLAVEEIAANIQEHGYGGERGKPLSVLVRVGKDETFEVTLQDRARFLDITQLVPGNLKELARRRAARGRGVALVHLLVQSVEHKERRGGGNEVTLTFDAGHLSRVAREHTREAA
jgi:anti-sigma regulatory factor (Ser/Thr protein kinase)